MEVILLNISYNIQGTYETLNFEINKKIFYLKHFCYDGKKSFETFLEVKQYFKS